VNLLALASPLRPADLSPFACPSLARAVVRQIRESAAVICDLSEARPNVFYEAAFAHALEKPTIPICSTPLAGLPFDVRNWNTLEYAHGRTIHLREGLTVRVRAVLT